MSPYDKAGQPTVASDALNFGEDLAFKVRTRGVIDSTENDATPAAVVDLRFRELAEHHPAAPMIDFVPPPPEEAVDQQELERCLRSAAAREEGRELARGEFDVELTASLAEERRRLDRIRLEFARDRQRFFAAAEGQVVRLAVAIAERVLSREVETDGLHLRATVKAALGRVQDSSVTTLKVPLEEMEAWAAMLQRESAGKVKVVGDERMKPGDCVLETTVGRVEMGVNVQLAEIERGFNGMLQVQESDRCGLKGTAGAGARQAERRRSVRREDSLEPVAERGEVGPR